MTDTNWDPSTNQPINWSKNATLDGLKTAGRTYSDSSVGYSDPNVFYNGYDPTGQTPDDNKPTDFTGATNQPTDFDRGANQPTNFDRETNQPTDWTRP